MNLEINMKVADLHVNNIDSGLMYFIKCCIGPTFIDTDDLGENIYSLDDLMGSELGGNVGKMLQDLITSAQAVGANYLRFVTI